MKDNIELVARSDYLVWSMPSAMASTERIVRQEIFDSENNELKLYNDEVAGTLAEYGVRNTDLEVHRCVGTVADELG